MTRLNPLSTNAVSNHCRTHHHCFPRYCPMESRVSHNYYRDSCYGNYYGDYMQDRLRALLLSDAHVLVLYI
ncbi:hypothetical protein [Salmonella enterica]|uniref:hypothetical protein n=1 Tax=Salmonella enterica TaxID=28901 RepID=UPI0020CAEC57|nr:hypothetical protein [Salmonella enterica]